MSLYVPDGVRIYEADMDNMVHAIGRRHFMGLGFQVLAQAVPNMSVRTTGGPAKLRHDGNGIGTEATVVTVAATDPLAIAAADPASPRIDLVHVSLATGVTAVVTGTPASTPKPPALPSGSVLLGYVSVAAAATNIQQSNITQRALGFNDDVIADTLANRPSAVTWSGSLYVVTDGVDGQTIYRASGATGTWVQIAMGAGAVTVTNPNLVPNSDFGRRTILGYAMGEVFADLNSWTAQTGTLGTVAANVLTPGSTGAWRAKWNGPTDMWRDGRWVSIWKATTTGEQRAVEKYIDANNMVRALYDGSNLTVTKIIAGTPTTVATTALALTLNNWYCLELSAQGTTYVAAIWNLGAAAADRPTTPPTLQVFGTVADAGVVSGGLAIFENNTVVSLWGGRSGSPGGVYVETWLPESWTVTLPGTLGGQAIGYVEVADAGPLNKQWAVRGYIPNASRQIVLQHIGRTGDVIPSISYAGSTYMKVANKGGSGTLLEALLYGFDAALGNPDAYVDMQDAGETVWTRKTGTKVGVSTNRRLVATFYFNAPFTATGEGYYMLPQFEQGANVTVWRPAAADDAPITWEISALLTTAVTTTSAVAVEIDPRSLAGNLFVPWDASLSVSTVLPATNTVGGNFVRGGVKVDGTADATTEVAYIQIPVANQYMTLYGIARAQVAFGKHRVALYWYTNANTAAATGGANTRFVITAVRGK